MMGTRLEYRELLKTVHGRGAARGGGDAGDDVDGEAEDEDDSDSVAAALHADAGAGREREARRGGGEVQGDISNGNALVETGNGKDWKLVMDSTTTTMDNKSDKRNKKEAEADGESAILDETPPSPTTGNNNENETVNPATNGIGPLHISPTPSSTSESFFRLRRPEPLRPSSRQLQLQLQHRSQSASAHTHHNTRRPSNVPLRPLLGVLADTPHHHHHHHLHHHHLHHRVAAAAATTNAAAASAVDDDDDNGVVGWDYSETEWWGWIILIVTWMGFVIGMGSCFGVWSWAWDVGETPYAPPELEDDPTLPVVGYYPALIILTAVMAWVWVVVAWVGMKYFKHANISSDDT